MLVNTNTSFAPLKKTWVGTCYPPEFFDYIKNTKVRQLTQQICEETLEDLETFKNTLARFNVKIEQPDIVLNSHDAEHMIIHGKEIPRPPLSPRDNYLALGNTLYRFANDPSYDRLFSIYKRSGADVFDPYNNSDKDLLLSDDEYDSWWSTLESSSDELTKKNIMHPYQKSDSDRRIRTHLYPAASVNRCGTTVNIESLPQMVQAWTKSKWQGRDIHFSQTNGGMKDGRFSTLRKGLILALQDLPNYDKTYPNWDVIILPGQGNLAMKTKNSLSGHAQTKARYADDWYTTGELGTEHEDYVDRWINYWVDYTRNNIVDVNAFSIDEDNVILNGYNEQLYSKLEEYGITAHFVHFRHRYFWDGGHHCNTVDIVRDDSPIDYVTVNNKKTTTIIEMELP